MEQKPIGFRSGRTVSLSYEGFTRSLIFETADAAKEMMQTIIKSQSQEDHRNLVKMFNGRSIVSDSKLSMLDKDRENNYYLKGYTIPMPIELVQRMMEYYDQGLPLEPLLNFWLLCMDNPDPRAREDLFKFAEQYNFPITPFGYFVGYKSVYIVADSTGYIKDSEEREKVRNAPVIGRNTTFRDMAKSKESNALLKYQLFKLSIWDIEESGEDEIHYFFAEADTPDQADDAICLAAELGDSFAQELDEATDQECEGIDMEIVWYSTTQLLESELTVTGTDESDSTFTDIHTQTFSIKLGEVVKMPRDQCDADPERTCSSGLHIGAPGYVHSFGGGERRRIIACLVNPAHVVAVPTDYSFKKMRVCEYYPYAISMFDAASNLNEVDTRFYESDYIAYEVGALKNRLEQFKVGDESEVAYSRVRAVQERLTIISL